MLSTFEGFFRRAATQLMAAPQHPERVEDPAANHHWQEAWRVCCERLEAWFHGADTAGARGAFELLEPRQMLSAAPMSIDLALPGGATTTTTVTITVPAQPTSGAVTNVSLAPIGDALGLTQTITPLTPNSVPADVGGTVSFEVAFATPNDFEDQSVSFQLQANGAVGEAASAAGFLDVIIVIDESGSMLGEQEFIGGFVQTLEEQLLAAGFGLPTNGAGNQYGLVGFGRATSLGGELGRSILVGDDLFGTADEFAAATDQLVAQGSREDGFAAIDFALGEYAFRDGSERIVVLVTDEPREALNNALTVESFIAGLEAADATLVSVLSAGLETADGQTAIAIDATGNTYQEAPGGAFAFAAGGSVDALTDENIAANYIAPTFQLNGLVADLDQLRLGGNAAASFSAALVDGILNISQAGVIDLGTVEVTITAGIPIPSVLGETVPDEPTAPPPQPLIVLPPSPPTGPISPFVLTSATSAAPEAVIGGGGRLSNDAADDAQVAVDDARAIDQAFAEGYDRIALAVFDEQQPTLDNASELLLVVAETNAVDALGYTQSEETPLRRPAAAADTRIVLDLPEPAAPLVVRGQEPAAPSPMRYWWVSLAALPPLSLWYRRWRINRQVA